MSIVITEENAGKINEALDKIQEECNNGILGNPRNSLLVVKLLAIDAKKALFDGDITPEDGGKTA